MSQITELLQELLNICKVKTTPETAYSDAVELTNKYSKLYAEGKSNMPDEHWDQLYKAIRMYEQIHPTLTLDNSPTKRVGEKATGREISKHTTPMLSLGNVFDIDELHEWFTKAYAKLKIRGSALSVITVEPKYDGCALTLQYINGVLVEGRSRGDGVEGEVIPFALLTRIEHIPLTLKDKYTGEIRGEVMVTKNEFERIQSISEVVNRAYANARNMVAGVMRMKDFKKFSLFNLSFFQYSIHPSIDNVVELDKLHGYQMRWADEMGFYNAVSMGYMNVNNNAKIFKLGEPILNLRYCFTIDDLPKVIEYYNLMRDSFPFNIDGMVFKFDSMEHQAKLGMESREPNYAIAYKFPAVKANSVLRGVRWYVGRTGVITPVALISPVVVGDVTVENVTLHNKEEIKRLGLRIGDNVIVARQGDVIPKIVHSYPGEKGEDIEIPTHCMSCDLILEYGDVEIFCTNPTCTNMLLAKLSYFVSRDGLDIKGIGTMVIGVMHFKGISTILKFVEYMNTATPEQMYIDFPKIPQANVKKIIDRYKEVTTKMDIVDFITALGIPLIGKHTAKAIFTKFIDMDTLRTIASNGYETAIKEFSTVEGVSDKVAKSIYLLSTDIEYGCIYDTLVNSGTEFSFPTASLVTHKFDYVVTGSFGKGKSKDGLFNRQEAIDYLDSIGGKNVSKLNEGTYLIIGANGKPNTSKMKIANSFTEPLILNIEDDLESLINLE